MRSHLLALAMACLAAWFIYDMLLDIYPPLIVQDAYEVLSKQPVARNDTLRIRYRVTVERTCPGLGRRIFIDAGHVSPPTVAFATDTGEREDGQRVFAPTDPFDVEVEASVPNSMAPGAATYQNESVYFCNFWQRLTRRGVHVAFPQVSFTVADETLPAVKPSTSIFKRTERSGTEDWLFSRASWSKAEGE